MRAPLSVDTAHIALESILARSEDITPERILATVAHHFDLSEEELIGRSRARSVSVPRQLAMYLIREETGTSLPQIGKLLGGRDHTTVMHGCAKIGNQIEASSQLRRDWLAIKEMLAGAGPGH